MKIYIRSMSRPDAQIYDKLDRDSEQLDRHLIKLMLYPDAQEADHWAKEVWNFINIIDRRKQTNKYPKETFIYKAISCHNDIISNMIWQIKSDMQERPRTLHDEYIVRKIEDYQHWLARKLSTQGAVNSREVYEALDVIGIKPIE